MWQRIQSIYLAITAIAVIAMLFIPVASLEKDVFKPEQDKIALIISIGMATLSLYCISIYRNRKSNAVALR